MFIDSDSDFLYLYPSVSISDPAGPECTCKPYTIINTRVCAGDGDGGLHSRRRCAMTTTDDDVGSGVYYVLCMRVLLVYIYTYSHTQTHTHLNRYAIVHAAQQTHSKTQSSRASSAHRKLPQHRPTTHTHNSHIKLVTSFIC